ncbi:MAG: SemiSWEET family transporter [Candidatus Hodarchaeaceae archaeon]|nr:SemiSWEET family transporter [Candidatus Hodarchaeaceae archaeon]
MSTVEIEILGIVAAILVNAASIPQVLKTATTKQVRDISLPFWMILLMGAFLWAIYGILVRGIALILSSLVTCSLCLTMIALILRYR